jgi:ribosomal-protein-alanine N-acetyltransferase
MIKSPFPFHLREMRLSDISAVMAIEEAVFPVPWKASAYEYEITRNRMASYQVLTVRLGDRPAQLIGYGGYWILVDEAHVSTIGIDPTWQGRGLGELLLLNMLFGAYDQEASVATLEVRRGNLVAQTLYQKYGFAIVGERKRYYQGTEDAIIMTTPRLDSSYRAGLRRKQQALYQRLEKNTNL